MLHFLILTEWPYIEGILWVHRHSTSGHLSWVLQGFPLCELCLPSFCSWASIAADISMGGVDSKADWLWGLATTAADKLLYIGWHQWAKFSLTGLWWQQRLLLGCVYCGGGSWPWSIFGLKLLGVDQVQWQLYWVSGHLVDAKSDLQLVVTCVKLLCTWERLHIMKQGWLPLLTGLEFSVGTKNIAEASYHLCQFCDCIVGAILQDKTYVRLRATWWAWWCKLRLVAFCAGFGATFQELNYTLRSASLFGISGFLRNTVA